MDCWTKLGTSNWIFLQVDKSISLRLSPSKNMWLIDMSAAQHVWRTVKEAGFHYFETRKMNQHHLGNISRVMRFPVVQMIPNNGTVSNTLKTSNTNVLVLQSACQ
jgi:hypothetical protein